MAGGIQDFGIIRPPVTSPGTGPGRIEGPRIEGGGTTAPSGGPSFGQALESALKTVDSQMQAGDASATSYIAGENVDLHNVMLDLERADLSFKTMVQVRNKLLDAYKEVMRIPV